MSDVAQFLSGKSKSAKFETIGDTIAGTIVAEPRLVQQKDYDTDELLFHKDSGKPVMQLAVTVQTDIRDDSEDDGRRTIWYKGQPRVALIEALKKAGLNIPREGDFISDRFTEEKPTTMSNGKPGYPQKIHEIEYKAVFRENAGPSEGGQPAGNSKMDTPADVPPPHGVDPGKWARMNEAQRTQLLDALGLNGGFTDEPPF
jgi:hypothetical protein